ncbi:mucin-5AC [Balaenoptera musculus]|uniref:Mucin-5AC n=1 Tax=Balaenoptera musculus TaxID=9771 RepID=A0A8B8YCY7_BALMU|nr:mucin-5AC [Balaenoptera musculus]
MGAGRRQLALLWALGLTLACAQHTGQARDSAAELGYEYPDLPPAPQGPGGNSLRGVTIHPPLRSSPLVRALNAAHGGRVCSTWGDFHYKTFDGDVFRFPGLCNYVFSAHCGAAYEDFNLQLRRGPGPNATAPSRVTMKLDGMVVELTKGSVLVNGRPAQLPFSHSGVFIEQSSSYVKVAAKLGLVFMWNQDDSLLLELDAKYANQTCGLCGDFNGVPIFNEFFSHNIKLTPTEFGNLQKMDGPTERCQDPAPEPPTNCLTGFGICEEVLSSELFSDCAALVDTSSYLEACRQDLCRCDQANPSSCLCHTLAEYSRQCSHAGGLPLDWRRPQLCPQTCPLNMQYHECGSPCADTCSNPERSPLCEDHCVAGCFCPEGTVLDDIGHAGCIPVPQCSCVYNGATYTPGTGYSTDCTNCTCSGGRWRCQEVQCPGTCSVLGGAHFSTFDERQYTVHGDCSYVLAKPCDSSAFTVLAELRRCGLTDSETCLKSLTLILGGGHMVFVVKASGEVFVNQIYTQLPLSAANITLFRPSTFFIIAQTQLGLQLDVQLVPVMQVFVRLAPQLRGQTCGLCGNFNRNQADDFRTVSGVVEGTAAAFANTWKTQAACPNVKNGFEDPCSFSVENEKYAQRWCSRLTDPHGPFARCHAAVNPSAYYSNCMFDTCSCEKSEDCMCAALSSYVRACAARGVLLGGWRDGVCTKPMTTCPKSLTYLYNISTCQPTCRARSDADATCSVSFVPVDGCTCPDGTFLDDMGKCVPATSCPCYRGGSVVPDGESTHEQGVICTCTQGTLTCIGGHAPAPVCTPPMVYFDCRNTTPGAAGAGCQKSCHTLDMDCYSSQCVPGCVCPHGLVANGDGGCIPVSDCPCVHNEASYQPGQIIRVGCNTCTCKSRMWQCTDQPCPATCAVYGDGHYLTFDGQRYSFSGDCEYTLLQDHCGGNGSAQDGFRVITENVPCGTTGTTCSKAIKIFLGSYELKLSDGNVEVIEKERGQLPPFSIRQMGIYLVVDTDVSLVLLWDKGTSIFLRLSPEFKGRVCGLCGNFDDNALNDFTTRSQSVVGDALEFGNSWKFSPSCPDAQAPKDPCAANPYRKPWAQKQCSVVNSATFSACHAHVESARYYEACVSDACACDSGGDCECFCTAVAAYAQACHEAGVCVSWRTPDVCPLFCDYYNPQGQCEWHYQPCGAPFLRTCRNPRGQYLHDVRGLEGCYPKCPSEAPIFDEDQMRCVASCPTPTPPTPCRVQGKSYRPGSTVPLEKNCHYCVCTESGVHCTYDSEACVCTYDGKRFRPGEVIYHTTDGTGGCISAHCGANGTIERRVEACSPTPRTPQTTFIFSTTPFVMSSTLPPSTHPSPSESTAHTPSSAPATTPGTSPGPTPPTASSPPSSRPHCGEECQWSPWLDVSRPGWGIDSGDFDTLENLRAYGYRVCRAPRAVECRAEGAPEVPLEVLGQHVECSPTVGLTCYNRDQASGRCDNYQIRILCCSPRACPTSSTETTPPATFSTTETGPTPGTSRVTSVPTGSTGSSAPVTTPGPTTASTTSKTPGPGTSTPAPGTPTTGKTTLSTPSRAPVSTTVTTTTSVSTTTPGPSKGTSSEPTQVTCLQESCTWTKWIDGSYPGAGRNSGDFDSFQNLRSKGYKFCAKPKNVECRAEVFPNTPLQALGQNLICDKNVGLICWNKDQLPPICYNYQIRILCCEVVDVCRTKNTPPTTPGPTQTTTGETSTARATATFSSSTQHSTASSAHVPPRTRVTARTNERTSPGTTSCQPQCTWTKWFDVDFPSPGPHGGDFETYSNIVRRGEKICHRPEHISALECRAENHPDVSIQTLGQVVQCSPEVGLVCRNQDQKGKFRMCLNYEVRVLCCEPQEGCPVTHVTVPSTSSVSVTSHTRTTSHEATSSATTVQTTSPTAVPITSTTTVETTSTTSALTTSTTTVETASTTPVPTIITTTVETTSPTTAPRTSTTTVETTSPTTGPTISTTTVETTTTTVETTGPTSAPTTSTTFVPIPETTPSQPGTTSCQPQCTWTKWFDVDFPSPGPHGGDFETYSNIVRRGEKICHRPEYISALECRAENHPDVSIHTLGQVVQCSPEVGLVCRNQDQKGKIRMCLNYEVRVLCCEPQKGCPVTHVTLPSTSSVSVTSHTRTTSHEATSSATTVQTTSPTTPPTISTTTVETTSTTTVETTGPTTPPTTSTTTVETTSPTTAPTTSTTTVETTSPTTAPTTSTTTVETTGPTTAPTTSTTTVETTSPTPVPTIITTTVETTSPTTAPTTSTTTVETTSPTPVPTIITTTVETTSPTTAPTTSTTTVETTGPTTPPTTSTTTTASTTSAPTTSTTTVETTSPTSAPSSSTTFVPIPETTPSQPGTTSCQPQCTWTKWFDVDFPSPGPHGGDFETYSNIVRRGEKICHRPEYISALECRAENHPDVSIQTLGQVVQCSPEVGLVCRNQDQKGKFRMCFNYEVRVLCCEPQEGCPVTHVTVPSTSSVSVTSHTRTTSHEATSSATTVQTTSPTAVPITSTTTVETTSTTSALTTSTTTVETASTTPVPTTSTTTVETTSPTTAPTTSTTTVETTSPTTAPTTSTTSVETTSTNSVEKTSTTSAPTTSTTTVETTGPTTAPPTSTTTVETASTTLAPTTSTTTVETASTTLAPTTSTTTVETTSPTPVPTIITTTVETTSTTSAPTTSTTFVPTTSTTSAPTTSTTSMETTSTTSVETTSTTSAPTEGPTSVETTSATTAPTTSPTTVPITSTTSVETTSPTTAPTTSTTTVETASTTSAPTTSTTTVETTSPTTAPRTSTTTVETTSTTSAPTTSTTSTTSPTTGPTTSTTTVETASTTSAPTTSTTTVETTSPTSAPTTSTTTVETTSPTSAPSSSTTFVPIPETTPSQPGTTSCQPQCTWTKWFDVDFPSPGPHGGDFETYSNIVRRGEKICHRPEYISALECRAENHPDVSIQTLGQVVQCSPEVGLVCRNQDQKGKFRMCFNYEVRVLCCEPQEGCPVTHVTVPSTSSVSVTSHTRTTSHEATSSATTVQTTSPTAVPITSTTTVETTSTTSALTTSTTTTASKTSAPTTSTTTVETTSPTTAPTGSTTIVETTSPATAPRTSTTTVETTSTTSAPTTSTTSADTTSSTSAPTTSTISVQTTSPSTALTISTTTVGTTSPITTTSPTTAPSSSTTFVPIPETTPSQPGTTSCQPQCTWTKWFDVDFPSPGPHGGDFETYSNIVRRGEKICHRPEHISALECRAENHPDVSIQTLGQVVQCSPEVGLVCRNQDQKGKFRMCFNYEVRVLCCEPQEGCPVTHVTVPSTSSVSVTSHTRTTSHEATSSATTVQTTSPTAVPITSTTTVETTSTTSALTTSTTTVETASTTPVPTIITTTVETTSPTTAPRTSTTTVETASKTSAPRTSTTTVETASKTSAPTTSTTTVETTSPTTAPTGSTTIVEITSPATAPRTSTTTVETTSTTSAPTTSTTSADTTSSTSAPTTSTISVQTTSPSTALTISTTTVGTTSPITAPKTSTTTVETTSPTTAPRTSTTTVETASTTTAPTTSTTTVETTGPSTAPRTSTTTVETTGPTTAPRTSTTTVETTSPTSAPSSSTTFVPIPETTPSQPGTTSCQPQCTWTKWFDVDFPSPGPHGGDFETYSNIVRRGEKICHRPEYISALECRAENHPDVSIQTLGQVVQCSPEVGLVCRNQDQKGKFRMCLNYEVRVLCCEPQKGCPVTQVTVPSTSGVSVTSHTRTTSHEATSSATTVQTTSPTAVPITSTTSVETTSTTSAPTTSTTSMETTSTTSVETTSTTSAPTEGPTSVETTSATTAPTTSPTTVPITSTTSVETTSPATAPTTSTTTVETASTTSAPTTSTTTVETTSPTTAPRTSTTTVETTSTTSAPTTSTTSTTSPTTAPTTSTTTVETTSPTTAPTTSTTTVETTSPTPVPTIITTTVETTSPTTAPTTSTTTVETTSPTTGPTISTTTLETTSSTTAPRTSTTTVETTGPTTPPTTSTTTVETTSPSTAPTTSTTTVETTSPTTAPTTSTITVETTGPTTAPTTSTTTVETTGPSTAPRTSTTTVETTSSTTAPTTSTTTVETTSPTTAPTTSTTTVETTGPSTAPTTSTTTVETTSPTTAPTTSTTTVETTSPTTAPTTSTTTVETTGPSTAPRTSTTTVETTSPTTAPRTSTTTVETASTTTAPTTSTTTVETTGPSTAPTTSTTTVETASTTSAPTTSTTTVETTGPTTAPSSSTTFVPIPETTPSQPGTTSCQPQCTWTKWFDVDFPSPGPHGGDFETYNNIVRRGEKICHRPEHISALECRAENHPDVSIQTLGQVVQCSPEVGLVCRNQDQKGKFRMCLNYEVRVLCCEPQKGCLVNSVTPFVTSSPQSSLSPESTTFTVSLVTSHSSAAPSTSTCYCSVAHGFYSAGSIIYQQTDLSGHCYYAVCSLDCHVVRRTDHTCPTSTPPPAPATSTPASSPSASVPAPQRGCPNAVPPRMKGETWAMPNCSEATCEGNGAITVRSRQCPKVQELTCANGYPAVTVANQEDCCPHYMCQCVCSGWGDPHYLTFDGTYYTLLDNCTYVLVQQIVPVFGHFRVLIDNYFCDAEDRLSCPQSIIVEYQQDRVVLTRKPVRGVMTNEIIFNGEVVRPGFQKDGIIVSQIGIKMYVAIPALGVQVMFSGLIFSVEVPFSKFSNNTEGQCGTCTNDQKDECRLPGGAVVSSCSDMSGHWNVTYPGQPSCHRPPLTPTTVEPKKSPTSCPPSPICLLILSEVFKPCHSVIPPWPYYQGCTFDQCHMPRGDVVCSSLELYATLCASLSVCIDWRGLTNHTCSFTCPADKVYRPCGPSNPSYCYMNDSANTLALPEAIPITEGCFCPEDMMLFSSGTEVCVPANCSSCLGPHGEPVEPGHTVSVGCQECTCKGSTRTLSCQTRPCPLPPTCPEPGFVPAPAALQTGQCCPQYTCVCNATHCPAPVDCPEGSHSILTYKEGACCPTRNCSWTVCSINGTLYQPGAIVSSNLCEKCWCELAGGPQSDTFVISCETQICSTRCPVGFEYQTRSGQCCGECVQVACVMNTSSSSAHLFYPGEPWSDPRSRCVTHECEKHQDGLVVVTTKKACPPLSCPADKARLSEDGCCLACPQNRSTCTVYHKLQVLRQPGCSSVEPVRLTYCQGNCGDTGSVYSLEAHTVEHRCRCCRELRASLRNVTLRCEDGSSRAFSYTEVEECGCVGLQCDSHGGLSRSGEVQLEQGAERSQETGLRHWRRGAPGPRPSQ